MIGRETAEEGAALISTAIAQMIEDAHEQAMAMPVSDPQALLRRAESLHAVGADMATLAQAMAILARRGEPWTPKVRPSQSSSPSVPAVAPDPVPALSREASADAIKRRRALRIPGYATLADVGMDGEWVSPLQKTAGSLTGPVLIALHWLEVDAIEPNRAVLDELGYLPGINFNKVLNRALELAGVERSDVYLTQAFHLLPEQRSAPVSAADLDASFQAVTLHEISGRPVLALGSAVAGACGRARVLCEEVLHPSARGLSFEARAQQIAEALRRLALPSFAEQPE